MLIRNKEDGAGELVALTVDTTNISLVPLSFSSLRKVLIVQTAFEYRYSAWVVFSALLTLHLLSCTLV